MSECFGRCVSVHFSTSINSFLPSSLSHTSYYDHICVSCFEKNTVHPWESILKCQFIFRGYFWVCVQKQRLRSSSLSVLLLFWVKDFRETKLWMKSVCKRAQTSITHFSTLSLSSTAYAALHNLFSQRSRGYLRFEAGRTFSACEAKCEFGSR